MKRLNRTAAVVLFRKGKFCLSKRINTEAYKGYYQFPGGREDNDEETPMEIAQRELLEETKLDIPLHRFRYWGINPHDKDSENCFIYSLKLEDEEHPAHVEKHKASEWLWYTPEEVKNLLLIEGMQDIVTNISTSYAWHLTLV